MRDYNCPKLTEEEILNLAARIAVQARIDYVKRSQIENLLTSVEIPSDQKNSPWVVALYAYRQAGRQEIGRGTADLIYEAMSRLSEAGGGKEDVRKLLGFVKWIYESFEKKEGKEEKPAEILQQTIKRVLGKKEGKVDIRNLTFQDALKILREIFSSRDGQHARL
ncbi:MAG: hypothetical protein QXO15_07930 [Nitrososphaerota archaeon]